MLMTTPPDVRFKESVELIISDLKSRNQLQKDDIDGLCRDLRSIAGSAYPRITSEEQLKAESIIAYMFRPTVEECLTLWFGKSTETDVDIWQTFGDDVMLASEGQYDHWALDPSHPRMLLALVLLLDQFRRNMFRDTPQMYAADARCLSLVRRAIKHGVIDRLQMIERVFPCLVLTHSEALTDQHLCMEEWAKVEAQLNATDPLFVFHDIFQRHVDVIERFGRFPHRNELLGRASTDEELEFMENADFRFDLPLVRTSDGSFCFQGTVRGTGREMIEGDAVSLSYQGFDSALAQAEEQIRLQGYAQIAGTQLRKFIVEREMPAIDPKKYDEMKVQVDRVNKATEALWPRLSWVESFMCNNKMYCVYLADSAATLQKHALLADVPLTSVRQVRKVIDQGTFEISE
jgi:uncharacterized protein (DUF924 family)